MPVKKNVAHAEEAARVLCPHCAHLGPVGALSLDEGRVTTQCERCGEATGLGVVASRPSRHLRVVDPGPVSSPLEAKRAVSRGPAGVRSTQGKAPLSEEPFEVPDSHCAKCISPRGAGPSCGRCGLDFSASPRIEVPAWLASQWALVWDEWDSAEHHHRLLSCAEREDALWALGRLYRIRLLWSPEDPTATRACADLVRRASASLLMRPATTHLRARRLLFGGLVLTVLLSAMTWATFG